MNEFFSKYYKKLFFKQWVIGLCRGDIKEIIRNKSFDQRIKWLPLKSFNYFVADPFPMRTKDGNIIIFYEDFVLEDYYGKISMMTIDDDFKVINQKMVLDTKSHLSYPYIFSENGKIFIFPEAAHSGKLACYEYDPDQESISFLQNLIDLPMLDSSIFKYNGKYWLLGTQYGKDPHNKLYIYYSDNLLGPYIPHPKNPVKNSLNGTRPAGNFIIVDGELYRPSQNCENQYGESITINKINVLNEFEFDEEPHMLICIDREKNNNYHMHTIHTINVIDDLIVVDGSKWTFAPVVQWKIFLKNRSLRRQRSDALKNKSFTFSDEF